MHLSGDPTLLLVPEGASARADRAVAARARLRPAAARAIRRLSRRSRAWSISGNRWCSARPSSLILGPRIPYTLALAGGALLVALGIGIPAGIAMAVWRGGIARTRAGRPRARRAEPADILVRHPDDPALRRRAGLAADLGRRGRGVADHALGRARRADHVHLRAHDADRGARRARRATTSTAARARGLSLGARGRAAMCCAMRPSRS